MTWIVAIMRAARSRRRAGRHEARAGRSDPSTVRVMFSSTESSGNEAVARAGRPARSRRRCRARRRRRCRAGAARRRPRSCRRPAAISPTIASASSVLARAGEPGEADALAGARPRGDTVDRTRRRTGASTRGTGAARASATRPSGAAAPLDASRHRSPTIAATTPSLGRSPTALRRRAGRRASR